MEAYEEKSNDPAYHYGGIASREVQIIMDAKVIEEKIDSLLDAVKNSREYLEYKKQEELLDQDPDLKARVFQFRSNNFRLQNEADRGDLFQVAEQLSRESKELRRNPQVNAYLDAELALCRLMQKICIRVTEGIHIQVPEF